MKKKKRAVPAVLIVFEIVFLVLFLLLTSWWFGFSYPQFDGIAAKNQPIPGLSSGISPQGLCSLPENGGGYAFAMSGYIDGKPSRVYLISADPVIAEKSERYVTFTKDGEDIKTHFGGVTCSQSYMYIASGRDIIRIALEKVFSANDAARIEIDDSFSTGFNNAYCYLFGDMLYVGEFYRAGNYETPASHHMETGSGVNRAVVYGYPLDETREGGIADTVPTQVLSVCNEVQGIAVTEDKIFLSCSYGLSDSRLKVYPLPFADPPDGTFEAEGKAVPLWILDDGGGDEYKLPCMSEEVCFRDGKLALLFESMSLKYRFVTFTRESYIRCLDPADLPGSGAPKTFFGIPV